tara:strand:- start:78 stop:404 length:327 start_codon:yes stop_codon:yes gene_type:complete
MKECNKLVRNKVTEFIKRDGHTATVKKLSDKEYQKELLNLLIEEATEVQKATDDLERIVELADVLEVIDAIKKAFSIDSGDLTRAQTRKRNERGDFSDQIYLVSIAEQ